MKNAVVLSFIAQIPTVSMYVPAMYGYLVLLRFTKTILSVFIYKDSWKKYQSWNQLSPQVGSVISYSVGNTEQWFLYC